MQLVPFLVIFGIFYFLVIHPHRKEQKQHAEMLKNLKRGDRVVTTGGIHGVVIGFRGTALEVKIADEVKVVMERNGVQSVKPEAITPEVVARTG